MGTWQLQEAKARLSEVIETSKKDGPQIITQRGVKSAVVVPFAEWERRVKEEKPTLLEILQSGPEGVYWPGLRLTRRPCLRYLR